MKQKFSDKTGKVKSRKNIEFYQVLNSLSTYKTNEQVFIIIIDDFCSHLSSITKFLLILHSMNGRIEINIIHFIRFRARKVFLSTPLMQFHCYLIFRFGPLYFFFFFRFLPSFAFAFSFKSRFSCLFFLSLTLLSDPLIVQMDRDWKRAVTCVRDNNTPIWPTKSHFLNASLKKLFIFNYNLQLSNVFRPAEKWNWENIQMTHTARWKSEGADENWITFRVKYWAESGKRRYFHVIAMQSSLSWLKFLIYVSLLFTLMMTLK